MIRNHYSIQSGIHSTSKIQETEIEGQTCTVKMPVTKLQGLKHNIMQNPWICPPYTQPQHWHVVPTVELDCCICHLFWTHYDPSNRSLSLFQPLIHPAQHSKRGMEKLSTKFRWILNKSNICSSVLCKFAITENLAHRFSLSYAVPQPDNNLRNELRRFFASCDLWHWNELHFPHPCKLSLLQSKHRGPRNIVTIKVHT